MIYKREKIKVLEEELNNKCKQKGFIKLALVDISSTKAELSYIVECKIPLNKIKEKNNKAVKEFFVIEDDKVKIKKKIIETRLSYVFNKIIGEDKQMKFFSKIKRKRAVKDYIIERKFLHKIKDNQLILTSKITIDYTMFLQTKGDFYDLREIFLSMLD